MKIVLLVMMMIFVVSPCYAGVVVYNVQFSDGAGVYTGTNDIIKCTAILNIKYDDETNSKQAPITFLVDLSNNMMKTFKVEDHEPSREDSSWKKLNSELRIAVFEYVSENYAYVLHQSMTREQMAYRIN